MGVIERNIIAQCRRFNEPLPERIANKPKLRFGLDFFYESWIELDTDRPQGMGLASIPWSSLHNYATAQGLQVDDYYDFMHLVRHLDNAYILHHRSKGGS